MQIYASIGNINHDPHIPGQIIRILWSQQYYLRRKRIFQKEFKLCRAWFMGKKILFLVPYPVGESPSQRFRFEHFFPLLRERGFTFKVQSFLNSQNWQIFFKPGKPLHKLWALLYGFGKRWVALAQ